METDVARGEYIDPRAGRELLGPVGKRWLASRTVDPSTAIRYESLFRLHVEPVFGRRQVRAIRPSQVQAWLAALAGKFGPSTAAGAFLVLQGILSLAVADELIKRSPADSPIVDKPRAGLGGEIQPWSDIQVAAVTDAHPEHLRLLPELMTSCGLRVAEAMAVAIEDVDFDEGVLHIGRQLKKLGSRHVYALPKNDHERDVPLPEWAAAAIRAHLSAHATWPCTLPWEKTSGVPQPATCCCSGLTAASCATGATASRYGNPRSRLPELSPYRRRTHAAADGTRRRARKAAIRCGTTTRA
jgi:integrase